MTTSSTSSLSQISGLSSGIDTSSLVSSLMAVAAAPQNLLKNKLSKLNDQLKALQSVNTQAAALATAAKALAKPAAWTTSTATSSSTSVTATTTGSPPAGALRFNVTSLAVAHSVATSVITAPSGSTTPPSFQITHGTASPITVTATDWSAASIANAVNAADPTVSATVVHSAEGDRVLMTASTTGTASTFAVSSGNLGSTPVVLRSGSDAKLSLATGTVVTSATNTFSNLMSGVDVTVSKLETGVDLTVGRDATATTKQVSSLVDSLNVLLANVAYQSKAAPSTDKSTTNASGPLVGDATMRSLTNGLLSAVTDALGADSAATAGISVDRNGNATFDSAKFSSLLTANPAKAQGLVTALAQKLAGVASAASDPYTGSVSLLINGDKSTVTDLTDRIADWDDRLDLRRTTLVRQYTAMETALSKLQSQSGALTAALANLSND